jgi:hypothetical protein
LGHIENELLQTQIDVWLTGLEQDESEQFSRLGVQKIDANNSVELGKALALSLRESSSEAPFASILKHLVTLPTIPLERSKMMLIIDRVVQQLTIQRSGEDLDPASSLSNIDVYNLLASMDNIEVLKEQESRYQKQVGKTKRLEKELESADKGVSKFMTEKIMALQSKIEELEIKLAAKRDSMNTSHGNNLGFRVGLGNQISMQSGKS